MRASRRILLPVVGLLILAGCSQGSESGWQQPAPASSTSGILPGASAQSPGTQPRSTQPPSTQSPGAQPPGTQPPDTHSRSTQPRSTQPPGTQPPGTQPRSTQPRSTQPPGTQSRSTQSPGAQPPGTQPPGTQSRSTQPPGTQPRSTQPPATQPPGTQPRSTQPPGTQSSGTQPRSTQQPSQESPGQPVAGSASAATSSATPPLNRASNAEIIKRSTIPVLCWHQIRNHRASDSAYARTLITPPKLFAEQLAALSAAGYRSITPDELYDYLVYEGTLPRKPVLITLDDGWESEWVGAKPALMDNNMVATYFITTKGIDYATWISGEQLREMRDAGMTIGNHTTSHADSRHYDDADWNYQLTKSLAKLERIIGEPVRYFAYPYGSWNSGAFRPLSEAGIKLAFQLTEKPVDKTHPLLTQRRMMVDSRWSPQRMLTIMESVFDEGRTRKSNY